MSDYRNTLGSLRGLEKAAKACALDRNTEITNFIIDGASV